MGQWHQKMSYFSYTLSKIIIKHPNIPVLETQHQKWKWSQKWSLNIFQKKIVTTPLKFLKTVSKTYNRVALRAYLFDFAKTLNHS